MIYLIIVGVLMSLMWLWAVVDTYNLRHLPDDYDA